MVTTLPNIEEAEVLCLKWNNHKFTDESILKAHIHPFSSWRRETGVKSRHPVFK